MQKAFCTGQTGGSGVSVSLGCARRCHRGGRAVSRVTTGCATVVLQLGPLVEAWIFPPRETKCRWKSMGLRMSGLEFVASAAKELGVSTTRSGQVQFVETIYDYHQDAHCIDSASPDRGRNCLPLGPSLSANPSGSFRLLSRNDLL